MSYFPFGGLCLIVGFSFSNPFFTPFVSLLAFLPCHYVILAMLLFDSCLLGFFWVCYMFSLCLIPVARYYHWASIHAILGFPNPNYHILHFWGLWAFPPTPYSLNSLLWAFLAHPYLLSISHNAHGFTTFFSRLIWAHLLSLRPFCYFLGLWSIIPATRV